MRTILLLLCILSVTFSAKAQLTRDWSEGSYYDSLGNKNTGLICWLTQPKAIKKADFIMYKVTKKADKIVIPATQLNSFVIAADSFVVGNATNLKHPSFMKVILSVGLTKLYQLYAHDITGAMLFGAVGAAVSEANSPAGYYFGLKPNAVTEVTRKNFTEVMCDIMANKPEIVEKIKSKKLRYSDMDNLLVYYKTGKEPVKYIDTNYY